MVAEIYCNYTRGKIYRLFANGDFREVGSERKNGYLEFTLNQKRVLNHRYIMSQYLGRDLLSDEIINHINFDTKDNRIDNMEIVTIAHNSQWSRKRSTNKSGYKHISWDKSRQKWHVRIDEGGRHLVSKRFADFEDAIQHRDEKIKELNSQGKMFYLP